MKKNKIFILVFVIISIILIGTGVALELTGNVGNKKLPDIPEIPQKTITVDEILTQIPNTLEYKTLLQNSEVTYEKVEDKIIFTNKNTNDSCEVKINNNKLNIPYDASNTFKTSVYYILLEALNLAYENEIDLNYYLFISDPYLYSKIGVEKIELEDKSFELVLDFSKVYKTPADLTYISEDNLKYYGYDQKLKTRDSFITRIPEMRALKSSYSLDSIKIDIIGASDDQYDFYQSVLTFMKLLLTTEEYESFIGNYDDLETVHYDNFEIIVDYVLSENEKIIVNENERIVRIYYKVEEFK